MATAVPLQGSNVRYVGSNDISSGFPNLIVHSTMVTSLFFDIRFGLQNSTDVLVIGFGSKTLESDQKFQIGTYPNGEVHLPNTFIPYLSMNHSVVE